MPSPLSGVKILEFTHAVMGPSCGLVLADMGAEVVYVEPPGGSPTRRLKGFGTGYFPYFNRNKKSLSLDLKSDKGRQLILDMVAKADVVLENFAPGTMERLGLDYKTLSEINPKLVYCSMKGFLSGPYEKRTAMDEVVQMMGGLAYMTGPSGRPLRAGTSVIDITGGMFGAIAVLGALREREQSGKGAEVKSSLFETTAFLMGQHMAWSTLSQTPIPPMPERVSAWSVYQVFETADKPTFVGIISEKHWQSFCEQFDRKEWLERAEYASNNLRIEAREQLLPDIKRLLGELTQEQVMASCEAGGIPFAPIARPEDLFEDRQLNEGQSLYEVQYPSGEQGVLPKLPIEWDGDRFPLQHQAPQIGQHSEDVVQDWLGLGEAELKALVDDKILSSHKAELNNPNEGERHDA